MTSENVPASDAYEWVVAVPVKRNYLSHLAPASGEPIWTTRAVTTLCGWSGFAMGTTEDADSHRDKDGFRVRRRRCKRCKRAAHNAHDQGERS